MIDNGTSGDHSNDGIIKIGQNTEKSPKNWRRLGNYSNSNGRPSAYAGEKNIQRRNNNNNNNNNNDNPAPVLENNTHKLLWDFDIHMDHLISTKRPDLIIINKKKRTCKIVDFAVPGDYKIKLKECEKKDKYLDLARELKKLWNMQVTIIPIVIGAFGTVTKGLLKELEDLEVGGRVETIENTTLLRTVRNTEKSPGDLRRLAVTQTPVKNYQR